MIPFFNSLQTIVKLTLINSILVLPVIAQTGEVGNPEAVLPVVDSLAAPAVNLPVVDAQAQPDAVTDTANAVQPILEPAVAPVVSPTAGEKSQPVLTGLAQDTNPSAAISTVIVNAESSSDKTQKNKTHVPNETPAGIGVTLALGSAGIQIGGIKSLAEYFHSPLPLNLRATFSFLKTAKSFDYVMSGQSMGIVTGQRFSHADLTLDLHPFKRFFRLSLGAALNFNQITMDIKSNQGTSIGDVEIPAEDIGEIRSTIDFNPVALYLGLGGGNALSDRVSFVFDIGAYYQGTPKVNMEADGMLEPSAENASSIEDVFEKYELTHWWPVLNLGIGVKIF